MRFRLSCHCILNLFLQEVFPLFFLLRPKCAAQIICFTITETWLQKSLSGQTDPIAASAKFPVDRTDKANASLKSRNLIILCRSVPMFSFIRRHFRISQFQFLSDLFIGHRLKLSSIPDRHHLDKPDVQRITFCQSCQIFPLFLIYRF